MGKLMVMAALLLLCAGSVTLSVQAEEKVEVKKDNASWKMKLKHKNEKEWEGTHDGKTYSLRGDTAFTGVKDDDGDYTVYGTMGTDGTYITTTRVERFEAPRENGNGGIKLELGRNERGEKSERSEKSEK